MKLLLTVMVMDEKSVFKNMEVSEKKNTGNKAFAFHSYIHQI